MNKGTEHCATCSVDEHPVCWTDTPDPACPCCRQTVDNEEGNSCRNCDKPIDWGQYCSYTCEDMNRLPAPIDDQKLLTGEDN